MSTPRGFQQNGKSWYCNITQPQEVFCNFVVDSTNGNGLGVSSVKSNGYVEAVFMHTSATPGTIGSITNPNPPAGYAYVIFKNGFRKYLGGFSGQIVPLVSTTTTSTTANSPYVITSLGTTTLAQWQAKGLPMGFIPTVGQAFVATATGAIGGTGTVGLPGVPTASTVSVVGDPNAQISNTNIYQYGGARLLVQFTGATSSSVTTPIAIAPSDGTVAAFSFIFDASTVSIDGL
jgi:hypothetical protein